ncbi:MAG: 1-(5-phosphoribosyl)-5-[(5-phosphoribosylamino)methylideneamino] imidazole-4-carboxamide isomerase [Actinobacteria bacterium]|nr:1-(5-phosphoribosyl)-5-[(5-phosphoribosylamino)methylideneamino] imidazole-4-carboxamide isomerase [Actinomycetota bacterium]
MELYPAIDLRGGRCVRLHQGDYGQETIYGDDPVALAQGFADAGAPWVHIVDLDAARTGAPTNRPAVAGVAAAMAKVGVHVQSGGGVRNQEAAEALFDAGVTRVVIGTAAMEDPAFVERVAKRHPGGVAVGLDARVGQVAVRGWTQGSGATMDDIMAGVLPRFAEAGVAAVVVTEISRDGTLAGPDLEGLASVLGATGLDVIASGGVGALSDLVALAGIERAGRRLAGAIVGKAIYEGRFTVAEALTSLGHGRAQEAEECL